MTRLKSKPLFLIIIVSVIVLLLLISNIYPSIQLENEIENGEELFVSKDATPTPYPLTVQKYDQPPLIVTLWRQLFEKRNREIDPTEIIQKSIYLGESNFLLLYAEEDDLTIDVIWLKRESQKVYENVSRKLDAQLNNKVNVVIAKPVNGNCSPRGTTFFENDPVILLFADNSTREEQLLAVLGHELAHVFLNSKYDKLSDVALIEGMATWASRDYWEEWKGVRNDASVLYLINNKTYLPLFQNYEMEKAFDEKSPDCIANRDQLLTEFASFLDFLISNYGMDKLVTLFEIKQPEIANNNSIVYPPSYFDTYGLELNQLEYNWLDHIFGMN